MLYASISCYEARLLLLAVCYADVLPAMLIAARHTMMPISAAAVLRLPHKSYAPLITPRLLPPVYAYYKVATFRRCYHYFRRRYRRSLTPCHAAASICRLYATIPIRCLSCWLYATFAMLLIFAAAIFSLDGYAAD